MARSREFQEMADTTYLKRIVEPFVRRALAEEFGMHFGSRVLTLTTGGTHEFDAVSEDYQVIAAIKSASGKTRSKSIPSGKIKNAEAELYYLTLVTAPKRILILTTPEFYRIMSRRLAGRMAPGLTLKLIPLPQEIQDQVEQIQRTASEEVSRRA